MKPGSSINKSSYLLLDLAKLLNHRQFLIDQPTQTGQSGSLFHSWSSPHLIICWNNLKNHPSNRNIWRCNIITVCFVNLYEEFGICILHLMVIHISSTGQQIINCCGRPWIVPHSECHYANKCLWIWIKSMRAEVIECDVFDGVFPHLLLLTL